MSREVTFCENSTITEAWAVVLGGPAPVVEEEAAAIALAARRKVEGLARDPVVVVTARARHSLAPPYWNQQWKWDDGRHLARIGHRFLSVHRIANDTHRYETYETSLAPALDPWLHACAEVYDDPLILQAFEHVAYGYVNTFTFPADKFDLSTVLRLDLGVDLPSAHDGLEALEIKFSFRDTILPSAHVVIQASVRPEGEAPDPIIVQTKVTAQTTVHQGFWKDIGGITDQIRAVKNVAKRNFFELTTERTREQMGARYEATK